MSDDTKKSDIIKNVLREKKESLNELKGTAAELAAAAKLIKTPKLPKDKDKAGTSDVDDFLKLLDNWASGRPSSTTSFAPPSRVSPRRRQPLPKAPPQKAPEPYTVPKRIQPGPITIPPANVPPYKPPKWSPKPGEKPANDPKYPQTPAPVKPEVPQTPAPPKPPEWKPAPAPKEKPAPFETPGQPSYPGGPVRPAPAPVEKPAPAPKDKPAPVEKPAPAPEEKPAPAPKDKPAPVEEPAPAPKEEPAPAPAPKEEPAPAPKEEPAPAPKEEPAPAPAPKEEPAPRVSPAGRPRLPKIEAKPDIGKSRSPAGRPRLPKQKDKLKDKDKDKDKDKPIIPPFFFPSLGPGGGGTSGLSGGANAKTYMHMAKERLTFGESNTERTEIENVARPNSKRERIMSRNQSIKKQIIDENLQRKNTIKRVLRDKNNPSVNTKPETDDTQTNEVYEDVKSWAKDVMDYGPLAPVARAHPKARAFLRGAGDSMTFGFGDYLRAGGDYLAKNLASKFGYGKGTTFSKELAQEKEKAANIQKQEPGAYTAGEWAPAAIPVGGAAKGVYNIGKAAYQGYKATKGLSAGKKALELGKAARNSLTHPVVPAYQAAKSTKGVGGKAKAVGGVLKDYSKEIPKAAKSIGEFGMATDLVKTAYTDPSALTTPGKGTKAMRDAAVKGVELAAPGTSSAVMKTVGGDYQGAGKEAARAVTGLSVTNPSLMRFLGDLAIQNAGVVPWLKDKPSWTFTGKGGHSDKAYDAISNKINKNNKTNPQK